MKGSRGFIDGALGLVSAAALLGCAGNGPPSAKADCTTSFVVSVSPAAATANHASMPPANQVQFSGGAVETAPAGCPVSALARQEYAAWSNPDPADIQISSANDRTNGQAVCLNATPGAVTLAGVFAPVTVSGPAGSGADTATKTVQLTCQ